MPKVTQGVICLLRSESTPWVIFNAASAVTLGPFQESCSASWFPAWIYAMGFSHPQCRTLHVSLLSFRKFLLAESPSFSRSLWTNALLFSTSATPPSSALSAKLLRVHSVQGHAWEVGAKGTGNKEGPGNIQQQNFTVEK